MTREDILEAVRNSFQGKVWPWVSLIPAFRTPLGFTAIYEKPKFFPSSKYSVGFQAHCFAFLCFSFLSAPSSSFLPLLYGFLRVQKDSGAYRAFLHEYFTQVESGARMAMWQGSKVNGFGSRNRESLRRQSRTRPNPGDLVALGPCRRKPQLARLA